MRRTALEIFALGFAVSLAGDACHVVSGTTRYEWEGVPEIWHSALWFPFAVAGGILALALAGRSAAGAPARERTRPEVLGAAAAVLALYALTATLRDQPELVGVVMVSTLGVAVWAWWDPSPGAAVAGAVAAVAGPLAEIAVVALGASSYAADSDGLLGVAPWLPGLYFAAGAVAFRLFACLGGRTSRPGPYKGHDRTPRSRSDRP